MTVESAVVDSAVLSMRFTAPSGASFEIPDAWWREADMYRFNSGASAYHLAEFGQEEVCLVPIGSIRPIDLMGRQGLSFGGFNRARMIFVLRAFVAYLALPPVEILPDGKDGFLFQLADGRHRFYASIAAGFSHIHAKKNWRFEQMSP